MTTRVYRIQDADGYGPYAGVISDKWMSVNHTSDNGHPSPVDDDFSLYIKNLFDINQACLYNSLKERENLRFGFTSLEQLQQWFDPSEVCTLAMEGFNICYADVNLVEETEKQCIYEHDESVVWYIYEPIKLTV